MTSSMLTLVESKTKQRELGAGDDAGRSMLPPTAEDREFSTGDIRVAESLLTEDDAKPDPHPPLSTDARLFLNALIKATGKHFSKISIGVLLDIFE
jgi:hypothetical protein